MIYVNPNLPFVPLLANCNIFSFFEQLTGTELSKSKRAGNPPHRVSSLLFWYSEITNQKYHIRKDDSKTYWLCYIDHKKLHSYRIIVGRMVSIVQLRVEMYMTKEIMKFTCNAANANYNKLSPWESFVFRHEENI
jgi:hypothetical protein